MSALPKSVTPCRPCRKRFDENHIPVEAEARGAATLSTSFLQLSFDCGSVRATFVVKDIGEKLLRKLGRSWRDERNAIQTEKKTATDVCNGCSLREFI